MGYVLDLGSVVRKASNDQGKESTETFLAREGGQRGAAWGSVTLHFVHGSVRTNLVSFAFLAVMRNLIWSSIER